MNDTKIIKVISSQNKQIRVILLSATFYRLRENLKIVLHRPRESLDIGFKVQSAFVI